MKTRFKNLAGGTYCYTDDWKDIIPFVKNLIPKDLQEQKLILCVWQDSYWTEMNRTNLFFVVTQNCVYKQVLSLTNNIEQHLLSDISAIDTEKISFAISKIVISASNNRTSFFDNKNVPPVPELFKKVFEGLSAAWRASKNKVTEKVAEPVNTDTEQLQKYHDLLLKGIISQDEFDAKKKQILDL